MTYQDLMAVGEAPESRIEFIVNALSAHKASTAYRRASDAEAYYAKHNLTIEKFRKFIFNLQGQAVDDKWSADYRLKTLFFRRFVIQQVQYVLSNGVTFDDEATKQKLGADFDTRLVQLAKKAMVDGVAFGFWNFDHLEVFSFVDTPNSPGFVPLYDEDTSRLRGGIRYWYLGKGDKEIVRCTLYEEDGYTKFIKRPDSKFKILSEKRGYIKTSTHSEATGTEETFSNYDGFPIIPIYANDLHTSELEGIREAIDCYDFIKSGFANDIDENGVYWVLKNTGGMDDEDLVKFIERMKTIKATTVDSESGVAADAHTIDIPVEARNTMLDRLRRDLYEDFMMLDAEKAISGNVTATGIRLAYQPQDDKCGDFEYQIIDFICRLLKLVNINDYPTFKWNRIANQTEETQMVMTAASVLDREAILKHLPWITPEEVEEILKRTSADEVDRLMGGGKTPPEEDEEDEEDKEDEEEQ